MSTGLGVAALRGSPPAGGASAGATGRSAAGTAARRLRRPTSEEPLFRAFPVRAVALLGLVLFGTVHWAQMLEPRAEDLALRSTGIALAGALVLGLAGRLRRGWQRGATVAGALVLMTALAFLAARFPDEALTPSRWADVSAGIAQAIEALPGLRVPYRGLEEWVHLTIPLGATALTVLATALALSPRRGGRFGFPLPALIALLALYVTPSVALGFDKEFARGALLALLVLAFLRAERLRRRDAPAGLAALAGASVLALLAAPSLDRDAPWWDYETWALSASASKSTRFSWDHEYGPLDWPRDGREVLRVKARLDAYWKADNLDNFDGRRWVSFGEGRDSTSFHLPPFDDQRKAWSQTLQVTVRNMRSPEFIVAGVAEGIRMPGRGAYQVSPGLFQATRTLQRGDAYEADVYTPKPTASQMRDAGTDYPTYFRGRYMSMLLNLPREEHDTIFGRGQPDLRIPVVFPAFGDTRDPVAIEPGVEIPAEPLLRDSDVRRTWALAQRLREGTTTPYAYVRRVERHLRQGFSYSERPPAESSTLEGFLFDTKSGYCQQFSGAMALLLRMGGVPARVSAGFTTGSFDQKRREYVVRDLDAHSWVEAWFPGIGWVPFDPTPSSAPPRSQADSDLGASAAFPNANDVGTSDRRQDPVQGAPDAPSMRRSPWEFLGLVLALVAGIPGIAYLLQRRRASLARRPRGSVAELERALARIGRPARPGTTLRSLQDAFAHNPSAAGYLEAVEAQRYRPGAPPPTSAQRRGLRAELARSAGWLGPLRALWALPPRRLH